MSILSSTLLFLQYPSVLWQHLFYPGCLKFGCLYQPSFLYCAEQIGIPIIVKPFSTMLLNWGCLYQTTVKAQLVWLFCFTKPSILISSSLKLYCDGNSDICNVFCSSIWTCSSREQSQSTVENWIIRNI